MGNVNRKEGMPSVQASPLLVPVMLNRAIPGSMPIPGRIIVSPPLPLRRPRVPSPTVIPIAPVAPPVPVVSSIVAITISPVPVVPLPPLVSPPVSVVPAVVTRPAVALVALPVAPRALALRMLVARAGAPLARTRGRAIRAGAHPDRASVLRAVCAV